MGRKRTSDHYPNRLQKTIKFSDTSKPYKPHSPQKPKPPQSATPKLVFIPHPPIHHQPTLIFQPAPKPRQTVVTAPVPVPIRQPYRAPIATNIALPMEEHKGPSKLTIVGNMVILEGGKCFSPGYVEIEESIIKNVCAGTPNDKSGEILEADFVCAGFVDIHNHGLGGSEEVCCVGLWIAYLPSIVVILLVT